MTKYNIGDKLRLNISFPERIIETFMITAIDNDGSIFGMFLDGFRKDAVVHIKLRNPGAKFYDFNEWLPI